MTVLKRSMKKFPTRLKEASISPAHTLRSALILWPPSCFPNAQQFWKWGISVWDWEGAAEGVLDSIISSLLNRLNMLFWTSNDSNAQLKVVPCFPYHGHMWAKPKCRQSSGQFGRSCTSPSLFHPTKSVHPVWSSPPHRSSPASESNIMFQWFKYQLEEMKRNDQHTFIFFWIMDNHHGAWKGQQLK